MQKIKLFLTFLSVSAITIADNNPSEAVNTQKEDQDVITSTVDTTIPTANVLEIVANNQEENQNVVASNIDAFVVVDTQKEDEPKQPNWSELVSCCDDKLKVGGKTVFDFNTQEAKNLIISKKFPKEVAVIKKELYLTKNQVQEKMDNLYYSHYSKDIPTFQQSMIGVSFFAVSIIACLAYHYSYSKQQAQTSKKDLQV